jgi:hypothetical protein
MTEFLLDEGKGFLAGAGGIDQLDPLGFPLGESPVPLGYFFIKTEVEILETIFLAGGAGSAESSAAGFGGVEI